MPKCPVPCCECPAYGSCTGVRQQGQQRIVYARPELYTQAVEAIICAGYPASSITVTFDPDTGDFIFRVSTTKWRQ